MHIEVAGKRVARACDRKLTKEVGEAVDNGVLPPPRPGYPGKQEGDRAVPR